MLYRIAICDDEHTITDALSACLKSYLEETDCSFHLDVFWNVPELERAMRENTYDLLFLDIMIGEKNGMDFAKTIRENGNDVKIVFISSNTDYALEAYSVFPVSFLPKPIVQKDVLTVMDRIMQSINQQPSLLINDKDIGRTKVPLDSVYYLESMGHDILVQCRDHKTYTFGGTFSEFVETLPGNIFFRCHRSYAVNLRYVHRLQDYRFTMLDGSQIPIAKPLRKTAMQKFAELNNYD